MYKKKTTITFFLLLKQAAKLRTKAEDVKTKATTTTTKTRSG